MDAFIGHLILSIIAIILISVFILVLVLTFKDIIYDEVPIVFGLIAVLFTVPAAIMGVIANGTFKEYEDMVYIKSVSSDIQYQGRFVLGTGTINSVTYYVYYYEIEPNVYSLDKKETAYSVIYETNEYQPQLRTIKKSGEKQEQYVFYVPEGTISTVYAL